MHHELRVFADEESLAQGAATFIAERAHLTVAQRGQFSFAVSGGRSPWRMFEELALRPMPWDRTVIYQVDERVAPRGDDQRNLTHLQKSLVHVAAHVVPMAVDEPDLDAAAEAYAAELPDRFDLIHLGIGPDGHTASLVPGDPVLDVSDRMVAVTGSYQGRPRMTLTYPALARANQILWLVAGHETRAALAKLLEGDESITAGRVAARHSLVMTDEALD